jgi:hypothetical protein
VERVVGDEAAPDEAPESVNGFAGISAADCLMQRFEETGSGGFENSYDFFFAFSEWLCNGALLGEERKFVCEEKSDATVAFADGIDAGPGYLACSDERVETSRLVPGDASRKDCRLEEGCRDGCALKTLNGIEQGVEVGVRAAAGIQQALPVRE